MASAVDADGLVRVSVSDCGPGSAPEVAAKLFQPFISTKDNGMGLGLSICHAAMREMGGGITARNTPEGTVFRLTFQRVPAA